MENLQGGTLALEHRYHLDARIGSAGMVTLYEGTQDPFGLPVSIAIYGGLLEAGADESVAKRIKASATVASHLNISGLLAVVDFGEIDEGVPFVIEESASRRSLQDFIDEKGVLCPEDTTTLIARLAELLQEAHRAKLFHGNLKPQWIQLGEADNPLASACLGHFGLAPSMDELVNMPQAVLTTDLVEAFPPEAFDVAARDQQEEAEQTSQDAPHLSAGSDQWGLAALAYRLLVGVHPYFDDPVDASEGILRIKTEDAPSLVEMGVDESVADVIDRALARDPRQRWPSVTAFAEAMKEAVGQPRQNATARQERRDSESTQDDDDQPRPDDGSPDSPPGPAGPRPSGYLLTFALVALVISNLAWIFFSFADVEEAQTIQEDDSATATGPEILPSGIQVTTVPPDAQLLVAADEYGEPLAVTPHVITDELLEPDGIELLLRLDGYHDQRLSIEETEAGQNIALQLIEQ